jgi:hypothetical protein
MSAKTFIFVVEVEAETFRKAEEIVGDRLWRDGDSERLDWYGDNPSYVAEKLDAIAEQGWRQGWKLAYDGCHKLYFLQNSEDVDQARGYGYEIHETSEIRRLYENSCGLRFVNAWSLSDHELCIEQGES